MCFYMSRAPSSVHWATCQVVKVGSTVIIECRTEQLQYSGPSLLAGRVINHSKCQRTFVWSGGPVTMTESLELQALLKYSQVQQQALQ
jgi:hypothetical protein